MPPLTKKSSQSHDEIANHTTQNHETVSGKKVDEVPPISQGYFNSHLEVEKEGKIRVAKYVCEELVKDGDSIALDAGTSAMYVAEVLFRERRHMNLSILTHNMEVFNKFGAGYAKDSETSLVDTLLRGTNIQLILTGGEFSPSYNALFGVQTETSYNEFFPRLVILAISGLICSDKAEYASGLYCHATNERPIKWLLFNKSTDRRVVVADWKKLGRPDSYRFGELNKLSDAVAETVTIVTTSPPKGTSQESKDQFHNIVENLEKPYKVKVVKLPQD